MSISSNANGVARPLSKDDVACLVTQMTPRPGVQDDAHRPMLPAARCALRPVIQLEARARRPGRSRAPSAPLGRRSIGVRRAIPALLSRRVRLVLRLTGQQVLAQDVVHDSFLALWRAPEAYDPARGAFRTFFLSLVHHRAVDTVRREERLRKRTERAANLEPVTGEDASGGGRGRGLAGRPA